MIGAAGPAAFPRIFDWPNIFKSGEAPGKLWVAGGCLLFIAQLAEVFLFAGLFSNLYLYHLAKRAIKKRPDASVKPDAPESVFVEIVPRSHWNRMMFET